MLLIQLKYMFVFMEVKPSFLLVIKNHVITTITHYMAIICKPAVQQREHLDFARLWDVQTVLVYTKYYFVIVNRETLF